MKKTYTKYNTYIYENKYYQNNEKIYFNSREMLKNSKFLYEGNKVIAEFINNENGEKDEQLITTTIRICLENHNNYLDGYIRSEKVDLEENNQSEIIDSVDIYDKINLFIKWQEIISLMNFKFSNQKILNENEFDFLELFKNKNNELIKILELSGILHKKDVRLLTRNSSGDLDIPITFYNDIESIKRKYYTDNVEEQIKIDIYNQIKEKKNLSKKYDLEFDYVYSYYINNFYPNISIAYAITNDGKICEQEVVRPKKSYTYSSYNKYSDKKYNEIIC